jgi:hypothetical protein
MCWKEKIKMTIQGWSIILDCSISNRTIQWMLIGYPVKVKANSTFRLRLPL